MKRINETIYACLSIINIILCFILFWCSFSSSYDNEGLFSAVAAPLVWFAATNVLIWIFSRSFFVFPIVSFGIIFMNIYIVNETINKVSNTREVIKFLIEHDTSLEQFELTYEEAWDESNIFTSNMNFPPSSVLDKYYRNKVGMSSSNTPEYDWSEFRKWFKTNDCPKDGYPPKLIGITWDAPKKEKYTELMKRLYNEEKSN